MKYKAYSRRKFGALLREWAGRNKGLMLWMLLGLVALLAFETVIDLRFIPGPARWYLLGLLHAGLCAAAAVLLLLAFFAHERQAIFQMRGAWGEENTRDELARAKRRRLIWGWVDSVSLEYGDIDHLVVTRAGGIVAIDSKWRTATNPGDLDAMARDAQKTRLRAEAVVRTQLQRGRGSHRRPTTAHRVTPLLVIWGPVQHTVPAAASVEGVDVVGGRQLRAWLKQLDGERVERGAARDLLDRLERFRATAWEAAL